MASTERFTLAAGLIVVALLSACSDTGPRSLMQRFKNGLSLKDVASIDQEIATGKAPDGRRLDHNRLNSQAAHEKGTGAPYGLD